MLEPLDLKKGAGPDGLAPDFLVNCSRVITIPLTILYSRSVTEGTIPAAWKSAHISPIFKRGRQHLKPVEEIRDLDVIHDKKLTYAKHVDEIAKKANKAMGFILRQSSLFREVKVLKILYFSYVRSTLEYRSQVWNSQYHVHENRFVPSEIESKVNRITQLQNIDI
nr:uncharacterized protein LOC113395139 [Vanessa tameamea]